MQACNSGLEQHGAQWQRNAEIDPLGVILFPHGGKSSRWDEGEFFATGREEVRRIFDYMGSVGLRPARTARFLDFGCGVGRTARALAARFESGLGVDIAPRMIELAIAYNTPDPRRIEYIVNRSSDLASVPSESIDFVYCHIVLQHMSPTFQERFIGEFLRLLAPGGVAAFQVATGRISSLGTRVRNMLPLALRRAVRAFLRHGPVHEKGVDMEMHILPEEAVHRIARRHGCTVEAAPYTNSTDIGHAGRIIFLTRAEAIDRHRSKQSTSELLSQVFFVRKPG